MPGLGQTVHYTLTRLDAQRITQRRERAELAAAEPPHVLGPSGAPVQAGDIYPAAVVRVVSLDGPVNLQVWLDGNDVHWVERVDHGPGEGCWDWPSL